MIQARILFFAIMGLSTAQPISAQDLVAERVLSITGECQHLALAEEDLTSVCAPELIQVFYQGGHIELFVATENPDGRFLVFAGSGAKTAESVHQAVDVVTLGLDPNGDQLETVAVRGQCLSEDAVAGVARISCDVQTAGDEAYRLEFLSDGSAPENLLD